MYLNNIKIYYSQQRVIEPMQQSVIIYRGQADFIVENYYSSIYARFTDVVTHLALGFSED